MTEGKAKNPRFFDDHLEDHQPFPTLEQVLDVLDPHVGCNVEIKWTMKLQDGSYELPNPVDINAYVDTILEVSILNTYKHRHIAVEKFGFRIKLVRRFSSKCTFNVNFCFQVVLKYAGQRRIIFSCFNPDVCTLVRMKQNKYPVMFLTQGLTDKWPSYHDPRCFTIPAAISHATMMELLGINVHTEDLLKDPSQVNIYYMHFYAYIIVTASLIYLDVLCHCLGKMCLFKQIFEIFTIYVFIQNFQ